MMNDLIIPYMGIQLSKLHYNYFFLDKKEIALLKKLHKAQVQDDVESIFNLNNTENQNLLGVKALEVLEYLKVKTLLELEKIKNKEVNFALTRRNYLISSQVNFYEFSEIESALIEDVEDFIFTLDDIHQDVALSRWGFNHDYETLEAISVRYKLTRERIRQLEADINSMVTNFLRIHAKVLWQHIRERMADDLTELLPNFLMCFDSANSFYSFIELCCKVESGSLIKIAQPVVSPKLLNSFFCSVPSPVSYDAVVKELVSSFGYSTSLARNTLRELNKLGSIKITSRGVYPDKLNKKEAVAHALIGHPSGLPWKDISKIVNHGHYCSTKLNEDRLVHDYFCNSEYIYSCGRGTYRHLMYLDMSKIDIGDLMKELLEYFRENATGRLHLHDYYYRSKLSSIVEYFTLRYIVRAFGHEYGIYFDGKSGVDSLSLDPDMPRVTQKEVILLALNKAKGVMTKQEIAEMLRSKSLKHATFYLNQMIETGEIVRIDYMTYTVPDKAFKDVNIEKIMSIVERIVNSTNLLVEGDVFRLELNRELDLSYSKYFYLALISINLEKYGWYKSHNLISKNQIPYSGLLDVYRKNWNFSLTEEENVTNIRDLVLMTDITAENILNNWKNSQPSAD